METQTTGRLAAALRLSGLFLGLCTVVLLGVTIDRVWVRSRMRNWPTVTATVTRCGIHRDYPFQKDGGGIVMWVACDLQYAAMGQPYTAHIESTTRHTGRSGIRYTVANGALVREHSETVLGSWMRLHPPGSTLPVHYDPHSPGQPTLAGLDPVFWIDPVAGTFLGVITFAALTAAIAIGAARAAR